MKLLTPLLTLLFTTVQADMTLKEANLRFQEFRNQDQALTDILDQRRKVLEVHDIKAAQVTEEEYKILYSNAQKAIEKAGLA